MKLKKKELQRINDTIEILESIKTGETIHIGTGQLDNILRVLDISFYKKRKKDVKTFVKGKEQHIIEHHNRYGKISTYYYFPFQIEKLKQDNQ